MNKTLEIHAQILVVKLKGASFLVVMLKWAPLQFIIYVHQIIIYIRKLEGENYTLYMCIYFFKK